MGHEQQRRHEPADQAHEQFDAQELRHQLAFNESAQSAADAHRKQAAADDGGELQHRVAKQITRQCTGSQFIDQAAGGDDKDCGEQGQFSGGAACRHGLDDGGIAQRARVTQA